KVMLFANRNGLMYVLDRATGEFLSGKPFVQVTWMDGFDPKGRPLLTPGQLDDVQGSTIFPGVAGTNYYPPSYSSSTHLFYVPSWERPRVNGRVTSPSPAYGAMRAIDPLTGERKWEFRLDSAVFTAGTLTTASDLLFTGVEGDDAGEKAS